MRSYCIQLKITNMTDPFRWNRHSVTNAGTNHQHRWSTVLLHPWLDHPRDCRDRLQVGRPRQIQLDPMEERAHRPFRFLQFNIRNDRYHFRYYYQSR